MEVVAVVAGLAAAAVLLLQPRVRTSTTWRAMATPLASIIGSGFLVLAPLLAASVGAWAPLAILGVVTLAYGIGASIRFNIAHAEPLLDADEPPRALQAIDRLSRIALGIAYMISVAFYLRLLASFVLDGVGIQSDIAARALTTLVLATLTLIGTTHGLRGIESVEIPAVDLKLVVIGGLLAGMLVYNLVHGADVLHAYEHHSISHDAFDVVRRVAGMLLVVQGFETSRYLGRYYEAETRVRTMRLGQLISGAIYVVFAGLVVVLFGDLGDGAQETAILDAARVVTPLLVPLVILAAIGSQLSAAAADTAGGAEMLAGEQHHGHGNFGYLVVGIGAITIVWLTDIFSIVAIASRAFALYYLAQAVIATMTAVQAHRDRWRRVVVANVALSVVLAFVVVAAIPGGG